LACCDALLGVISSIKGFDMVRLHIQESVRMQSEGEMKYMLPNLSFLFQLEKAYDRIMMSQLQNRKGLTFGNFMDVSKDIKYADKQPIVSWGPRYLCELCIEMGLFFLIIAIWFISWFLPYIIYFDTCSITQVSKDIKYADKQPIVSWGPRATLVSLTSSSFYVVPSLCFSTITRSCLFPWQHQLPSASLPRATGDRAIVTQKDSPRVVQRFVTRKIFFKIRAKGIDVASVL
ncbi:unnamed protein product, partial [Musa hybrid cultivar]